LANWIQFALDKRSYRPVFKHNDDIIDNFYLLDRLQDYFYGSISKEKVTYMGSKVLSWVACSSIKSKGVDDDYSSVYSFPEPRRID
jgi:hypothetical protein